MKILKIHQGNPSEDILQLAVEILQRGGLVIHPTDTCYGIAADIHNEEAVKKLYLLKKMDFAKLTSIIVADKAMARDYAKINEKAEDLIKKHWPGALTIVILKGMKMPNHYNKNVETIGLRHPDCATSLNLVSGLKRPITTTSANISNLPSTYAIHEIIQQFQAHHLSPDLILDAGTLDRKIKPSTVIEITDEGVKVIRQGQIRL